MSKYNEIISNIQSAVPELSDPQNMNPSQADLLIKIASGIAPTIDNVISEMNNTVDIITNLIGNGGYCKPGYLVQKALAYQDGDNLVMNPDTFEMFYQTIDTTKQIIKQAAFVRTLTSDGNFYVNSIKVATIDSRTGKLTALTSGQLSSFAAYYVNFDPPGSHISAYSNNPNILKFNAVVTYYFGYNLANLKIQIANQLQVFKDTFTFNGILFINDLCSFLKANVPGLRNITLSNVKIDDVDFTSSGETPLTSGYFDYFADSIIVDNYTYVFI